MWVYNIGKFVSFFQFQLILIQNLWSLRLGLICYARLVYLCINRLTPSMANKPAALIQAPLWANCSITDATPSALVICWKFWKYFIYSLKFQKLFSICDLGNVCVAATWPIAVVHVFHHLHGHVYILHGPLADIRDWHAQIWQSGRHRGPIVHLHNLCPIRTLRRLAVGDCCKPLTSPLFGHLALYLNLFNFDLFQDSHFQLGVSLCANLVRHRLHTLHQFE